MVTSNSIDEFYVQIKINKGVDSDFIDLSVKKISHNGFSYTFESILILNSNREKNEWVINDIQLLEAYFTLKLQEILNQYNPNADHIEVLNDTHSIIKLKAAYCQHCSKKLYETYGNALGVVKKCSNCGRFSFYRDHK